MKINAYYDERLSCYACNLENGKLILSFRLLLLLLLLLRLYIIYNDDAFIFILYILYLTDNREDKVTESKGSHNAKVKLYDVSSRIRLTPKAEDDYINYTCEAQHDALPPDMALRVTVQLSVLCKLFIYIYKCLYRSEMYEAKHLRRNTRLDTFI